MGDEMREVYWYSWLNMPRLLKWRYHLNVPTFPLSITGWKQHALPKTYLHDNFVFFFCRDIFIVPTFFSSAGSVRLVSLRPYLKMNTTCLYMLYIDRAMWSIVHTFKSCHRLLKQRMPLKHLFNLCTFVFPHVVRSVW